MDEYRALNELEDVISGILTNLTPSGRTKLMKRVGKDWQKAQAARIKAQKNPDGSAFESRRRKPASMGQYAVKFLYPAGGVGAPRAVYMKSWRRDGHLLTGWDIEAGGERSFAWEKVIKWLSVSPEEQNKRAGRMTKRPTLKERAMFKKIRTPRYLKTGANEREAWVGFVGGIVAIASVHQDGGKDRPAKSAPLVKYPMRELLGMNLEEREELLDTVIRELDTGMY